MFNVAKIKSAAIWSAVEAGSSALLSILSVLFLARILAPEDYGQIATVQFISALIQLILSLGLSEAIIQKKELSNDLIRTSVVGTIFISVMGFLFCIIVCFIFAYQNKLTLMRIMIFESFNTFFLLLSIVPTALLLRNLQMKAFARRSLICRVCFLLIAIPLAVNGFGLWSVVYATLVQSILSFILLYTAAKHYLPKGFSFNGSQFLYLSKFGFFVMLENLLWSVMSRVFGLLIAIFHGVAALGLYNMATKLTDAILDILNTIVTRMALPIFSKVQENNSELKKLFKKATCIFNIISMPLFVVMALLAELWIPIILGKKWINAIPVLQIIAIMYAIMYSRMFVGVAVKAVGRSKDFLYLSFVAAIITLCAAFFTRNFTLIDTLIALAVPRVIITIPLGVFLLWKICKLNIYDQLMPLKLPIFIVVIILVVYLILNYTLSVVSPAYYNDLNYSFVVIASGLFVSYIISLCVLYKIGKLPFKL